MILYDFMVLVINMFYGFVWYFIVIFKSFKSFGDGCNS